MKDIQKLTYTPNLNLFIESLDIQAKSLTHLVARRQQGQFANLFHSSRAVRTVVFHRFIVQVVILYNWQRFRPIGEGLQAETSANYVI